MRFSPSACSHKWEIIDMQWALIFTLGIDHDLNQYSVNIDIGHGFSGSN